MKPNLHKTLGGCFSCDCPATSQTAIEKLNKLAQEFKDQTSSPTNEKEIEKKWYQIPEFKDLECCRICGNFQDCSEIIHGSRQNCATYSIDSMNHHFCSISCAKKIVSLQNRTIIAKEIINRVSDEIKKEKDTKMKVKPIIIEDVAESKEKNKNHKIKTARVMRTSQSCQNCDHGESLHSSLYGCTFYDSDRNYFCGCMKDFSNYKPFMADEVKAKFNELQPCQNCSHLFRHHRMLNGVMNCRDGNCECDGFSLINPPSQKWLLKKIASLEKELAEEKSRKRKVTYTLSETHLRQENELLKQNIARLENPSMPKSFSVLESIKGPTLAEISSLLTPPDAKKKKTSVVIEDVTGEKEEVIYTYGELN